MRSYTVAARASPLSQAQVMEVEYLLRQVHHHTFSLRRVFQKTYGDFDRKTSLRTLPVSDFFTREVDLLVQQREADFAVHSAKDLPGQVPEQLIVVGMTQGLDPRDVVVLRQGLTQLFPGAKIGTSSPRRDVAVRVLEPAVEICDLRGTIQERLQRLEEDLDGVVMAECALLRLGLAHLPRLYLKRDAALHQGRLAITARVDRPDLISWLRPVCVG